MATLSSQIRLQRLSWQLLEDLAFCGGRWPRLSAPGAGRDGHCGCLWLLQISPQPLRAIAGGEALIKGEYG
jgi:hypothetical protein